MGLEYINKIAPEHERSSCSDENIFNARFASDDFGGCYRCTLLAAAEKKTPRMVWILTSEYNEYDQHGEYFLGVFADKPTIQQIARATQETHEATLIHISNGGGRRDFGPNSYDDVWYTLRQEDI